MLNTNKFLEFFDAENVKHPVHIIGCGAIGSHICEQLARLGFESIHLYDFDKVEAHNIANQMFEFNQIGMPKVEACAQLMQRINPGIKPILHDKGLQDPWICNGIVLLCVDSIELRKTIVEANRFNPLLHCIADFRMRLTDAQHYFCDNSAKDITNLLKTMDFTHEEAQVTTPKSACGYELSVIYTVKAITAYGIANLINFLLGNGYKHLVLVDTAVSALDAF